MNMDPDVVRTLFSLHMSPLLFTRIKPLGLVLTYSREREKVSLVLVLILVLILASAPPSVCGLVYIVVTPR